MKLRTFAIAAALVAGFGLVPTAAAQAETTVEYVGGTATPGNAGVPTGLVAPCQNVQDLGNPGAGGVCSIEIDPSTDVEITVDDENNDGVGFNWQATTADGAPCNSRGASTEDAATIRAEQIGDFCAEISIYVGLGGTTGTVTIAG